MSVLLVEHDMPAVFALADRISVLVYGRLIASGDPDAIRANEDVKRAYLGDQHVVLFGLSLSIKPGEMVSLMGRNGMGKTTTIRSIMGLTPARAGTIRFAGTEVRQLPSYRIAKLGVGTIQLRAKNLDDAPALAQADVGVAMNTGTQAAREAGNMVDLASNPPKLIEV
ncbi:hypothetical protein KXV85_003170, partial [Aspergillus fumigatus]